MFGNDSARSFWRWFEGEQARLKLSIEAAGEPGCPINPEALGSCGAALAERLRDYAPGVTAEYSLGRDGACVITFTAGGALDLFEDVFALTDVSPILQGWEFQALRPRNAPARFEAFGIACNLDELRFAHRLGSDRVVIAVLADDAPGCDYRTRRAFASALVSRLLGEEDFGRYVSDVLMLEYETWLAATPGGRSAPLAVIAPTLDRIFRRPQTMRRPAAPTRLRLVS